MIKEICTLKRKDGVCPHIPVKQWDGQASKDTLFLLDFEVHCYVLLYMHSLKAAFIADGANIFRDDQETAESIKKLVNFRLISVEYDQQLRVDHCTSSAVLIGIELLRMKARGIREFKIAPREYWKKRLTQQFHPEESAPLKKTKLGGRRQDLVCPYCSKTFLLSKRQAYSAHITHGHKNERKNI